MEHLVLADVLPKYQSAFHAIQLAILAKVTDLHRYGYAAVLAPLERDVHTLKQDSVLNERVGQNVKGIIFSVSADSLAAHGLSCFVKYVCRFCMATREQFHATEVRDEDISQRTKASHDLHLQYVQERDTLSSHFGFKGYCVLCESLNYLHPITGFPPDLLHDLLEGIISVELSLCIKEMIQLNYFTLDHFNQKITSHHSHSSTVIWE